MLKNNILINILIIIEAKHAFMLKPLDIIKTKIVKKILQKRLF